MNKCNNKKLMQIYLDGWMSEAEIKKFENHLKDCPECQIELVDLEEVTRSALEIVNQAPERDYWENFINRVNNRIAARDIVPENSSPKKSRSFSLKYSFYSVAFMALAASLLIVFNIGIHKTQPSNQTAISNLNVPILENMPLISSGRERTLSPIDSKSNQARETINIPADDNSQSNISKIAENSDSSDETSAQGNNLQVVKAQTIPGNTLNLIRDLNSYFRTKSVLPSANIILSDISSSDMQSRLISDQMLDSSFKLRLSVIADGMLSGISKTSLSPYNAGSALLNQDYIYADLNGGQANVNDAINTRWGYLRMPNDTTRSADTRRYLIELELMQNK